MRLTYLTLLLLVCLHVSAQGQQKESLKGKLYIKVTPSSLLDYWGAQLPVGIEYGIGQKTSIAAEIAIPLFYTTNVFATEQVKINNDLKLRGEFRQYFKLSADDIQPFIGIDVTYRKQDYSVTDSSFYRTNNRNDRQKYFFSASDVSRERMTLGIYWGFRTKLWHRIYLDAFVGIGYRYLTVKHYNTNVYKTEYNSGSTGWWYTTHGATHFDGTDNGNLYIPLGIKLSIPIN